MTYYDFQKIMVYLMDILDEETNGTAQYLRETNMWGGGVSQILLDLLEATDMVAYFVNSARITSDAKRWEWISKIASLTPTPNDRDIAVMRQTSISHHPDTYNHRNSHLTLAQLYWYLKNMKHELRDRELPNSVAKEITFMLLLRVMDILDLVETPPKSTRPRYNFTYIKGVQFINTKPFDDLIYIKGEINKDVLINIVRVIALPDVDGYVLGSAIQTREDLDKLLFTRVNPLIGEGTKWEFSLS